MAVESRWCLGWAVSSYKKFQDQGELLREYPLSRSLHSPSANSPGLTEPFRGRSSTCASPHTLKSISICDFPARPALHPFPFRCYHSSPLLGVASSHTASTLVPDLPQYHKPLHFPLLHYFSSTISSTTDSVPSANMCGMWLFQVSDQPCYSLSFSLCWQSQGHFINEIHQYHKSTTFVYQDGQLQLTSHLVLLKGASCLCLISHRLSLSLNQINQSATRYFLRISGILLERRLPSRSAMRSLSVSVPTLMKAAYQSDLTQLGAFKEQCPGMSPQWCLACSKYYRKYLWLNECKINEWVIQKDEAH